MFKFDSLGLTTDRTGLLARFNSHGQPTHIPNAIAISVGQTGRLIGHTHFLMHGTVADEEFLLNAQAREHKFDHIQRMPTLLGARGDRKLQALKTLAAHTSKDELLKGWTALRKAWAACEEDYALPQIMANSRSHAFEVVNTYFRPYLPKSDALLSPAALKHR